VISKSYFSTFWFAVRATTEAASVSLSALILSVLPVEVAAYPPKPARTEFLPEIVPAVITEGLESERAA
jgi:hypothetical protein